MPLVWCSLTLYQIVKEKIKNPRLVFLLTGVVALIIVIIFVSPIIGANIEAQYPVTPTWGNSRDVGIVFIYKIF